MYPLAWLRFNFSNSKCNLSGSGEVALTDGADEIVEIATYNVKQNFPSLKISQNDDDNFLDGYINQQHVSVQKLRWGDDKDIERILNWNKDMIGEKKYDYVLASEVFYQRKSIDLLLQTMKMLVKPKLEGGLVVLRLTPELTDEAKGFDYLTSRMKKFGFDYKFVDTNNGSRDDDNDNDDEVDSSQLIICSVK